MVKQDRTFIRALTLAALLALPTLYPAASGADNPHAKWDRDIKAFEASDRTNPPPSRAIVFVGSSSIRMWKTLAEDFAPIPVINRGYGGSEMDDSLFFIDRLVLQYQPRQVVVYAGDNDLANGKSPERVADDFKAFVKKVREALPETRVAYIAVKPSPARAKLIEPMRQTNRLIAQFTATDTALSFIDVFNPMLGKDGKPREELFIADKLHLNRKGYALWTSLVGPHLLK